MLLDLAVGLAFVAVAALPAPLPVAMRWWWVGVGVAWWMGDVEQLRLLHQGVLIGALATYPAGRPQTRKQVVLLVVGCLLALGLQAQAVSAAGFLAVTVVRSPGPVFARLSACVVAGWLAGSYVWSRAWPESFDPSRALTGYQLVLMLVAVALPVGILGDVRRRASLADRMLFDSAGGLAGLEAALRRTLRAPNLSVTRVGEHAVVEGLGPVDAVTAASVERAVALTLTHERSLAATAAELRELQAAGVRLMAAADSERARAVHELRGQLTTLRHCQASLSDSPKIADEVAVALADVERIVAGLAPEGLGEGGIRAVLAVLCSRQPGRVSLVVDEHARGSLGAETALFYACSEALANVTKHAHADTVAVRLVGGNPLVLTVTDDGLGGADPTGSGLGNLRDRLSTHGGTLMVESVGASGTTLVATVAPT